VEDGARIESQIIVPPRLTGRGDVNRNLLRGDVEAHGQKNLSEMTLFGGWQGKKLGGESLNAKTSNGEKWE